MRDVLICNPVRTPVGKFGGALREVPAAELGSGLLQALLDRTGLPTEAVDDVVLGQCYPSGEAPAIGRVVALDAGLPPETPGMQVDRRCGSGLQAVCLGAMQVQVGVSDLVVAGGVESMSQVEHYTVGSRWGTRAGDVVLHDRLARARVTAGGSRYVVEHGMLETAENLRREFDISREDQDRYALRSHERAVAAQEQGLFDAELVAVERPGARGGRPLALDRDEHPRPGLELEDLAALRPVLRRLDPEATVTAGNASGQNDAAALCILATRERAEQLGLRPMGRLVGWALAGVEPSLMGLGPVPAVERVLTRCDLKLSDMDLIEVNEAFAVQVLAVLRAWGLGEEDQDRVNVHGSGIALGHPVGATGARMLATLLHEMARREDRYGLVTMCIGGGQGLAAVVEAVRG